MEVLSQIAALRRRHGIPIDMLINALNSLYDYDKKRAEAAKAAQAKAAAQAATGSPVPAAPQA